MLEVKPPQTLPCPEPVEESQTIAEAAARSGVSVHTLRYYERAGLMVTTVERNHAGRRRYHEADLEWIETCTRLRATGMPIRTIRRYAELVAAGSGNEDERLALMESHRTLVKAKLEEIEENLKLIDYKISIYRDCLAAGDAGVLWAPPSPELNPAATERGAPEAHP